MPARESRRTVMTEGLSVRAACEAGVAARPRGEGRKGSSANQEPGPLTARQMEEVQRYLATGEHDYLHPGWSGDLLTASRMAEEALHGALLAEVEHRSRGRRSLRQPRSLDLPRFTRAKVEPMVRGLFPAAEQDAVLAVLERSVIIVTRTNFARLLRGCSYLSSAWRLANLYLASVGAELLSEEEQVIVGFNEETRCFVSTEYFREGGDRFADFLLHETAHVFHNCKRRTVGLPETRRREWLLDIDFRKRETFAYACEAYGRILELGRRPADRRVLLAELLEGSPPPDDRVDEDDFCAALTEAVEARNGWKRILNRCRPRH